MWVVILRRVWVILGLGIMAGNLFAESYETGNKDDLIDVYMIPGLGTDYRVFRDFSLENGNIKYIQWEDPGDVKTLEEYASLLETQIDTSRKYVIVGASFGGMIGVELSQIYQAEWINAIRDTRIGGLILGFGFKGSDLLCYTLGCGLGVLGEFLAKGGKVKEKRAVVNKGHDANRT